MFRYIYIYTIYAGKKCTEYYSTWNPGGHFLGICLGRNKKHFRQIQKYLYIYIYPRGRRFTGNSCPKGVYIYEVGVTHLDLACPPPATAEADRFEVQCLTSLSRLPWEKWKQKIAISTVCNYTIWSWGGVGVGWSWGGVGVGWGGDGNVPWTCTHGRCYATSCSLHLHTWSVLRKSWDWGGVGWGW